MVVQLQQVKRLPNPTHLEQEPMEPRVICKELPNLVLLNIPQLQSKCDLVLHDKPAPLQLVQYLQCSSVLSRQLLQGSRWTFVTALAHACP